MATYPEQTYLTPKEYIISERKVIPNAETVRGDKFIHYRQLPSLQEYILVSQDEIRVEQFHRQENSWILTEFQSLEDILPLISIQCDLPLHEIYDRVIFPN